MPSYIKKHYHYLDLPYNSTIEEIEIREKALVKFWRTKGEQIGKVYTKKVKKIVNSSNIIISYVKKNGVPSNVEPLFDTNKNSIFNQLFVLGILAVLAICCVCALI